MCSIIIIYRNIESIVLNRKETKRMYHRHRCFQLHFARSRRNVIIYYPNLGAIDRISATNNTFSFHRVFIRDEFACTFRRFNRNDAYDDITILVVSLLVDDDDDDNDDDDSLGLARVFSIALITDRNARLSASIHR